MAASQTANTWSDLRDLLNAGVSVESALGLEEDSQGPPSPRTVKDNLTVDRIGDQNEVFEFHFPDASDIEVFGLPDVNERLSVLPPFIDLNNLLQPTFIKEHKPSDCVVAHGGATVDVKCDPCLFEGKTEVLSKNLSRESSKQDQSMEIEVCTTSKGAKRKRENCSLSEPTGTNVLSKRIREQSSSPELLLSSSDDDIVDLTGSD